MHNPKVSRDFRKMIRLATRQLKNFSERRGTHILKAN